MDNTYSLSDIATATGGGWGNNWGSGLGTSVIAGVGGGLLANAFFNNGGWGGGCGGRGNCATTEDLASGFNFQALQNKGNEALAAIQGTNQNLSNAVCQLGYQTLEQSSGLASKIDGCCCTTQRAVDSVKFDMANYASAIQMSQMQGTHQVLDKLCSVERALSDAQKDTQIAAQGREIDQLRNDLRFCRLPVISNVGWTVNPVPGCTTNYGCGCGNGAY